MALAALCSQLQKTPYHTIRSELHSDHAQTVAAVLRNIEFQAFIVDHGARESSGTEAHAVSKMLEGRGISTTILKIDWGGYQRPADLPNFESLARKHRFQVLGKACRDLGINSLFLAHHEDDQAETVMMRLIAGHRMPGLMGISSYSEIPECHGIYGVHESGGVDKPLKNQDAAVLSTWTLPDGTEPGLNILSPLISETGGIRIYRPLLHFSKHRLIATCQAEKMKWFEDNTNKDPTVTTRNAIRHINSFHTIPTALSKPALLNLSRKFRMKHNTLLEAANSLLADCTIKRLETRTGTLIICFANLNQFRLLPLWQHGRYSQQIAALLLRRIIAVVTPDEHVNISSLDGAVERIFPELFKPYQAPPPPTTFTVAGVQFAPSTSTKVLETPSVMASQAENCQWLISRQSYVSAITKRPMIFIPAPHEPSVNAVWTPWALYDGRFWFRIQNLGSTSIVVRPFRKDDMMDFRRSITEANGNRLRHLLKMFAPGDVRWTLPALVTRYVDGNEKVLALPTLDVGVSDVNTFVKWEVRYKKIDIDGVKAFHYVEP